MIAHTAGCRARQGPVRSRASLVPARHRLRECALRREDYADASAQSAAQATPRRGIARHIARCVIAGKWLSCTVIKSFADAETARIWSGRRSRRLPYEIQAAALRRLRLLNQARTLSDLRAPPGNRLEGLKGRRQGQYSIRINQQWRICFRWHEGAVHDVEIVDYHD
jgi:toxin HigB-1